MSGRRLRLGWNELVAVGVWVVLVAPLLVAVVAATRPRWYPVQDLAQYELRVRDVGGRHTPLVGLAGRIGPYYDPGSHPGPLSFWLLAPVYRLLGSSSTALVASAVALHATALGLVLWMAWRRAGVVLVAVVGGALAVLIRFYGANVFIEPWNPYLPVTWWLVLLFAVWSVADGDTPMLIPAVVAGTFCAQTHLPYVGLVGGLAVVTVAMLVLRSRAHPPARRRWIVGAASLGVVLWVPPVIDQIWGMGNLTRIRESVSSPAEGVSGFVDGPRELLRNLDPTALVTGRNLTGVSTTTALNIPALLLVLAWAAAAAFTWRSGAHRTLVRLHVVIGVALAMAAFSSTRIYGLLWSYLFLWAWGLAVVMVVAAAWTAAAHLGPRLRGPMDDRIPTAVFVVGLAAVVVVSASATVANRDAEPSRSDLSRDVGVVSAQLIGALDAGKVDGASGGDGYLVQWTDPVTIGSQGWGLVSELERAGYPAGFRPQFGVGGTKHRVIDPPSEATAIVQLVVGDTDIAAWDADANASRAAFVDSRTPAERRRYEAMVGDIEQRLRRARLTKQAREWRQNLFTTSIDTAVPEAIRVDMRKVLAIPAPVALYVVDPDDA